MQECLHNKQTNKNTKHMMEGLSSGKDPDLERVKGPSTFSGYGDSGMPGQTRPGVPMVSKTVTQDAGCGFKWGHSLLWDNCVSPKFVC